MALWQDEPTIAPAGTYAVKLENVTLDETKADPKLAVRYKLSNGQTMWQNFFFKNTTKKLISWQVGVIGVWKKATEGIQDPDAFQAIARGSLDAIGTKIGSYYRAKVTHREGKDRTFADLILEEEITASDAAKLGKTPTAQHTTPAPKQTAPPSFNADDSELPF